ncbi:alpha/beta-type small acid-soluble spore protein [Bacillus luteolus]|uniref:Alpha/beta-type small acid-soluble spore protein n=1 Tax=Litchfieldia luteola TaxID=682179 RepID=A0ABR9QH31_9BACI|nr:alpha/beta-type small acid-soluble spore protein [Cytobacillus luteolus]MBE4907800.1 alpha/beta-type small acid-soluble spore protein [Cytobacillus luteolus]MBP1944043.1 putative hydrolase (HD superfamily) [Cytobacillus luteolus]
MAKRRNRLLVPEAREEVDRLKARVLKEKGYSVIEPNQVKFEVANELGVPLNDKYNGSLTSKQAGKVGGEIGGSMVKEMIKMAQQRLSDKQ